MKYLIMMYPNAEVMDALSEEERNAVFQGHGEFMNKIKETGEFVSTLALAGTDQSSVVRVRGGVPAVTDGPYAESKEFVGGFYVVEVKDRDRAHELAAMIPDAAVEGLGIEVRPIVFSDGASA
ncbi:YciI family protein (plasmid) [Streptomyces sp. BHT-5-2]|uniref:YciI family protein n=1 Tax=unclassified Streptomyces TaxID=2593676 RepID=UPI001C8E5691|nr:YciI family protein [Streptomyces sp. BHT-5-2]QZL07860.1 YciI family protein [Streptomyces sp. BHT-5-2]